MLDFFLLVGHEDHVCCALQSLQDSGPLSTSMEPRPGVAMSAAAGRWLCNHWRRAQEDLREYLDTSIFVWLG